LFSIKVFTSSFIAVDDNINIFSLIPAFLNCKASSSVATAKKSIPLSIKNFVNSTIPSPQPFAFTTAIIFTLFPLSSGKFLLAYSFIFSIL